MKSSTSTSCVRLTAIALLILFATGCTTVRQGPVAPVRERTTTAPTTDTSRELEPPARSEAYPEREAFHAAEYAHMTAQEIPDDARQIRLRPGETRLVYTWVRETGRPETVFYLPAVATSVVQVIVERHGLNRKDYYLKAVGYGDTVGGVVERSWLDTEGFRARDAATEGRIQQAVRKDPWYISVDDF